MFCEGRMANGELPDYIQGLSKLALRLFGSLLCRSPYERLESSQPRLDFGGQWLLAKHAPRTLADERKLLIRISPLLRVLPRCLPQLLQDLFAHTRQWLFAEGLLGRRPRRSLLDGDIFQLLPNARHSFG
jgi:hypothetical protein